MLCDWSIYEVERVSLSLLIDLMFSSLFLILSLRLYIYIYIFHSGFISTHGFTKLFCLFFKIIVASLSFLLYQFYCSFVVTPMFFYSCFVFPFCFIYIIKFSRIHSPLNIFLFVFLLNSQGQFLAEYFYLLLFFEVWL